MSTTSNIKIKEKDVGEIPRQLKLLSQKYRANKASKRINPKIYFNQKTLVFSFIKFKFKTAKAPIKNTATADNHKETLYSPTNSSEPVIRRIRCNMATTVKITPLATTMFSLLIFFIYLY